MSASATGEVGRFVLYSFLGWCLESVKTGTFRTSAVFGHRRVPLIPLYGVGALAVRSAGKRLRGKALPVRFGAYAAGLTGLEYAGCVLSDAFMGAADRAWRYENALDKRGCTDLPHALAWGVLGTLVDEFDPKR